MRAVKTNHILLMFTGKIQKNRQASRFFVKLTEGPKQLWIHIGIELKCDFKKSLALLRRVTNLCKNELRKTQTWKKQLRLNDSAQCFRLSQYVRKRDFFFYNNLQHYCNYKVDGRKKVEAEESVRVFQQDSCCYPI